MKHLTKEMPLVIEVYSAGVAPVEFYPDADILIREVAEELKKRGIFLMPKRKVWDKKTEGKARNADLILVADEETKKTVIELIGNNRHKPVYTFYGFIGEGEKDFIDTYDRNAKRQDPVLFTRAFDELWRIALKSLKIISDDIAH